MAPDASPVSAVHTAFSWLTVLPLPQPRGDVSRSTGRAVIGAVPIVGVVLGAMVAAAAFGLSFTALPALLIGVLCVGLLALATRGMHLDGLADTADGLGCYGDADRVREVMRSGSVGPFGAATLVLVLLVQAAAFAALVTESRWYTIVFAVMLSRVAAVIACRARIGPSSTDGFGALVAGTQRTAVALWPLLGAGLGILTTRLDDASSFTWTDALAPLAATLVVTAFVWLFTRHCARRMGGVNGDVLGASIELSAAAALLVLVV